MSKFLGIIIGAAEIAVGVIAVFFSIGIALPFAIGLIVSGATQVLAGIGTILTSNANQGVSELTVNPIGPRAVGYGRSVIGGRLIFRTQFGDNDKYLDLVIALTDHPIEAVDRLYFNKLLVQIDSSNNTSFTPVQQTVDIESITRSQGVVTVVLGANIPYAADGVDLYVKGVSGDQTLNAKIMIDNIVSQVAGSPGSLTFTYLNGGSDISLSGQGQVETAWPDYGQKVYCEYMLGNQTQTFQGMLNGTPSDGDVTNLIQNSSNPWTDDRIGNNVACVFLRLHYSDTYFVGGIPSISFGIRGKNDILDIRTGLTGYTENPALIIADYMCNARFGLGCIRENEIPDADWAAQANVCDEPVPLANGGAEPRYTINGKFTEDLEVGLVIKNMLTACGGKLYNIGGQWLLRPAVWTGSTPVTMPNLSSMVGAMRWSPAVTSLELFNGVRGKYTSPSNRWIDGDYPAYAQDTTHGYGSGPGGTYLDINVAIDGERRWLDLELPFTITASMAQRLAKIALLRSRQFGTGSFIFNMSGYQFIPGDVLSATLDYLQWTNKLLEVTAVRMQQEFVEDEAGNRSPVIVIPIDVQETSADVYTWSTTEELTPDGYTQGERPTLASPWVGAAAPPGVAHPGSTIGGLL